MNRHRLAGRRWPGPGANLLHVARPLDREGLQSPHAFEHGAIGPLRGAIDRTGESGRPISTGLVGGPCACSAAGLPLSYSINLPSNSICWT
jgi:hypothetical protein